MSKANIQTWTTMMVHQVHQTQVMLHQTQVMVCNIPEIL